MGDVYRAFDPVTRRELALKVLKFTYPRALHYFKREFRAVARLNHPNLVRLYDLHLDEGAYFFTMELVDGTDLYLYVNGHNRVVSDRTVLVSAERVGRIRETFIQLMRALAHLHDHGCVHRDIKPSNVLVDRHGTVKLVDFGIVKELLPGGEGQSLSQVFGTSTYFSPEQSQGSNVGAATDLYAAGVVLYELLCGSPPFEGESSDVALKHRNEKPRPVQERVANVDEQLARVCMELLSKEPSLRPSARETLEMLGAEVRDDEPLDFEFVGRRGPRKLLHQCLEAVRRGEGRLVVIEGSSGTGKTALVEAFAKDARLFGASAFTGQCVHRDHVPLRGLDTVVERLAEAYRKRTARILRRLPEHIRGGLIEGFSFLGELLPTDQHGPPGEPPGQGLRRLLAALAADRLLIITVEHLHLADDATLDVLEELQAGGELPPVLLLVTLRPEPASLNPRIGAFLELVAAHPRAHRLRLDAFSLEETRQLLEDAVPEAQSWMAEHVHAETGGVPLFVAEMAADIKRDPAVEAPAFEDGVARRIARLTPDAQRVVTALSLCPRPAPGAVLERACHLEVDALHAALDVLDAADLVRTEVDSVGNLDAVPVHSRLMDVARQLLDPRQAQDLHQRLAQAYQLHKGSAFDVRHHWAAAGQPDHAIAYARREALNARRENDHGRAADLLALALEGANEDQESQIKLRAWLADSLAMSGRYLEAAQALDELAQLSPIEGNRWRARRCQLYLMAGNLSDFDRLAVDLPVTARVPLADLLLPLDPTRAEQLLGDADTRTARLVRGRLMAGTHSRRAIAEARRLVDSVEVYGVRPEPSRQAAFAIARAQVQRAAGEEAGAAATIRQARGLLSADDPDHDLVGLRLLLGEAETALERGRVREARAAGRQLLVAARARGLTGLRARACVLQARVHLEAGEPEPAARLVDEAARSWPASPRAMPHVDQALVRARQGLHASDLHRAESVLLALRRDESLRPFLARRAAAREFALLHARICAVRALRRWHAEEDTTRAVQALVGARTALDRALPKPDSWLLFFDAVVELVEGRAEQAHARVELALRNPEPWPDNPQVEALLLLVMAQALAQRGEPVTTMRDEALELLAEAGAGVPPEGEPLLG